MEVVDKDFTLICKIFRFSWGTMFSTKIPLSYENHLSTCQGWDFNKKISTGSIFVIGPSFTIFSGAHATVHLTMSVGPVHRTKIFLKL